MESWKFLSLLLVLSLVELCSADKACAHVPTKHNFTVPEFLGRWYEIMRFPDFPLENASYVCVYFDYSHNDENVSVFLDAREWSPAGDYANSTFEAQLNETDNSKWRLFNPSVPYWIIDTDYETYAAAWTCVPNSDHTDTIQYSWILSRKPFIAKNTLDKLLTRLSKIGIPVANYEATQQNNCWKYY